MRFPFLTMAIWTRFNFSFVYLPVSMASLVDLIQCWSIMAINMDIPIMDRFLLEFRSMNCKFDNMTPASTPKLITCRPPITEYGIVTKNAPTLPITPRSMNSRPRTWNTLKLATWKYHQLAQAIQTQRNAFDGYLVMVEFTPTEHDYISLS